MACQWVWSRASPVDLAGHLAVGLHQIVVDRCLDALPQPISQEVSVALAAACANPLGATTPVGEDDQIIRSIVTPHTRILLFLGQASKTIAVLAITYLG